MVKIFLQAVVFILLVSATLAQATEIDIKQFADDVAQSINYAVASDDLKDNIIKQIEKRLNLIKLDEAKLKRIIDSIGKNIDDIINKYGNSSPPQEEIEYIIRHEIENINTGIKSEKETSDIIERIEKLEAVKQPKMLRPNEDISFLFEAVIGNEYIDPENMLIKIGEKKIKKIKTGWWSGIKFIDETDKEVSNGEKVPIPITVNNKTITKITYNLWSGTKFYNQEGQEVHLELADSLEAKMQAIERTLGIRKQADDNLINRIERVHRKLNNYDWQTDDLRFGILTGHLQNGDIIATSVVMHSYFGYRRFMPGKFDIVRRMSFFFAVGTASRLVGESEISGPIYSAGIGFDVVKGVVMSLGYSKFSFRENKKSDYLGRESLMFGISLNTELWKGLFNK